MRLKALSLSQALDGGMVHNSWMVQHLSSVLNIPVDRPKVLETTALGAAYLAGLQAGLYKTLQDVRENWQGEKHFEPKMDDEVRKGLLEGWNTAVGKVLS